MAWPRFLMLVNGLSPESRWQLVLGQDHDKPRVLAGKEVDNHFAALKSQLL